LRGKGGRCVGLTSLPFLCGDCLVIWEPQTPVTLRACLGLWSDCRTFYHHTTFPHSPCYNWDTYIVEFFFQLTSVCVLCRQPTSHNFLQLVVTFNVVVTIALLQCYQQTVNVCCRIHYLNQQMHLTKYNKIQILNTIHDKYQLLHVSTPECHLQGVYKVRWVP